MELTKEDIRLEMENLQDDICKKLEHLDGKGHFREDQWSREGGGGGRSRVIEGQYIEKGGVNFSAVHGETPKKIIKALELEPADFFATGVSIVLHPYNPFVPIIHMNVRYFEMSNGIYWFGGGIDVTPHYINLEEAQFFHKSLKEVCDRYDPNYYDRFKKWADDYFYLKHRKETRGIGGIFFDRLNEKAESLTKSELLNFILDVGNTFIPAYEPLLRNNCNASFSEHNKNWQMIRRGRYVEFNLVWDKGTKFGLDTEGRTESILMSMPPLASWKYNYQPDKHSPEGKTQALLKKGLNFLDVDSITQ
jgi:coproporphyrinogen III oxidase